MPESLAARLRRMADSETLPRRAIELAPGFMTARANLTLILNRTGRHAEARAIVDDILKVEPDDFGHRNLKAAILGRLGRFDDAIAAYREVLVLAPRQPAPRRRWTSRLAWIGARHRSNYT